MRLKLAKSQWRVLVQTFHSVSHCKVGKKYPRSWGGQFGSTPGPKEAAAAVRVWGWKIDFQQMDSVWFLLIQMVCLFKCTLFPDKMNWIQTAITEIINMFSKGLMRKQEPVQKFKKKRCFSEPLDVYGHRRKVHQSWISSPVPDVQPAHQTPEPATSVLILETLHSFLHPLILLVSPPSHTNKNKMSQMSAAWRDESEKPTRRTLMKNKSLLNPIWGEPGPNTHHSRLQRPFWHHSTLWFQDIREEDAPILTCIPKS